MEEEKEVEKVECKKEETETAKQDTKQQCYNPEYRPPKTWYERLWDGEYSLKKSFWGFWFGGNFILGFLYGLVWWLTAGECGRNFGEIASCISLIRCFAAISCFWVLLAGVGVWKAASKYKGFELWKHLARLCVAVAFLRYTVSIIKYIIFTSL